MTKSYQILLRTFIDCELSGITLAVEEGKLVAFPVDRITDDLASRIRNNKDAIRVAVMRSSGLPPCRLCQGLTIPIPTFDGFENFECVHCGECSGCKRP